LHFFQSSLLFFGLPTIIFFGWLGNTPSNLFFSFNGVLIYCFFLLIDLFFIAKFRLSLIKNLFFTTHIQVLCNRNIRINRKMNNISLVDLDYIGFEDSPYQFKISQAGVFLLITTSIVNTKEKYQKYYFGGLLTNREKSWLSQELSNQS
jgi:hypothetical protein